MSTEVFYKRHIGPSEDDSKTMLEAIGYSNIDELINKTIPEKIRLTKPLNLDDGMTEYQYLQHIKKIAAKNKMYRSFIGMGYYNTMLPPVIQRNILENPGWYTTYTPYQAEISQGRLEALFNFQTAISDLTGLEIANASLLDEATAASEAMIMFYNARNRKAVKANVNKFFVDCNMFPQTIELLKTRSKPLGIELVIDYFKDVTLNSEYFGAMVQFPNAQGRICDFTPIIEQAQNNEVPIAVGADILSLAILTPPGEWGADIVFGSTQRFGIPLGFGGPHAAYFATKEAYKRHIPGRIIGLSIDAKGNKAYRMALQTREQHIKRERATSNICTAQALLATMAGMYATYYGEKGLKNIAKRIHKQTVLLAKELVKLGYTQNNDLFFDTIHINLPEDVEVETIEKLALDCDINLNYIDESTISISLDETTQRKDLYDILAVFARANNKNVPEISSDYLSESETIVLGKFVRKTPYLTADVFKNYHSETELMRYIKYLEKKDLGLHQSMIPLGSCTMKLNAAIELLPLSWPEFGNIHPFVPKNQAEGYYQVLNELEEMLCEITGFDKISFQPNSGAAGEYAGMMVIRAYQEQQNEGHRNIALIPSSAHGTNPASAAMAGMKVVVVKCDENGNIEINDLKEKAEKYKDTLSCIMVTYPSTHGVFEENILEIIQIVHNHGGQVYLDGANMNAQIGFTNPAVLGADVCHLNLHKTFAIPHGGGGPGMGPIGVAKHLAPFLPKHPIVETGGETGITAIAAAPFGSALITIISHAYIKLMGSAGMQKATEYAILNANYLRAKLQDDYTILYTGNNGNVAHEMILDCNPFKRTANIEVIDIAKRLIDYGFHAPTVAFPVHGTLMVEPTESEPLYELDRFVEAMKEIRKEIAEIEAGNADKTNNIIKNSPHTIEDILDIEWNKPYTKQQAVAPAKSIDINNKYWATVKRIDDAYGDRNLVCTCKPIENYDKQ